MMPMPQKSVTARVCTSSLLSMLVKCMFFTTAVLDILGHELVDGIGRVWSSIFPFFQRYIHGLFGCKYLVPFSTNISIILSQVRSWR